MMPLDKIPPSFISYEGEVYKVSYHHHAGPREVFIEVVNTRTCEQSIFLIKDYGAGSGNESLQGTLEAVAAEEFVEAVSDFAFAESMFRKIFANEN